jgi:pyruvate kinase
MALIQEEILGLCQGAHVPEVWATQVLETLAKKGLPSRAEVTDAASSLQAECVMLNKGPHIVRAVRMLDAILKNMKDYRHDKAPMLPPMTMATQGE